MLVKAVTRAGQSSRARSVQCSAAARRHEIRHTECANYGRRQALAKWPVIRKLRTTCLLPDSVGGRNSTFDISAGFSHIRAHMKSMTGYGRGECAQDGFKITVELSSVNRKQSEISVALPREMEILEAPIRDLINRHIARGRLTARVSLHAGESKLSARMHLNIPLA